MKQFASKSNRALLSELVRTDFKLRYQGSLLGYAWSLLKPLLLFVILYVVFVYFLKIGRDIEHFPVYLLLGIVLWNFFTEMTIQSLGSIVARGDLIRKIRIPRWMIVFSSSISATINLLLSLIVVGIFMVINGVPFTWSILVLPLYVGMIYLLALGCSLFLAAAYVKFRDLSYIWEVILQAGFYATPIIYPLQMIGNETIEKILLMNPMAFAIQGARHEAITTQALTTYNAWDGSIYVIIPVVVTLTILVVGLLYFKSQANNFAENI
jgi:ABC-type polysaccharide/polyol phosphate export systems, permease component